MYQIVQRAFFFLSGFTNAAALAYGIGAVFFAFPMSVPIFVSVFIALATTTGAYVVVYAYNPDTFRMIHRIRIILWCSTALWFWAFASLYFLLMVHVDALQLRWAFLIHTWELFVFGAGVILVCMWYFLPVQRYLDGDPASFTPDQIRAYYRRVINYPALVFGVPLVSSALGYAAGSFQLWRFASMPIIEASKNMAIGFIVSIFLAVIFYVVILYLLAPVRASLEATGHIETPYRAPLLRRLLLVVGCVVVGSALLLQLVAFHSIQDGINNGILTLVSSDTSAYANARAAGIPANFQFVMEDVPVRDLSVSDFSPETIEQIRKGGRSSMFDWHETPKAISVFRDPISGEKHVGIIYISRISDPLWAGVGALFTDALLVFFVALGIAALMSYMLTDALRTLIDAVRRLAQDPFAEIPRVGSADEIDTLSETLDHYVQRVRVLDHEKDEFVEVASHQLRTPVTHLVWIMELLEQGTPRETIDQYFPDIKSSVGSLAETVGLLLDARRIGKTQDRAAPAACDLASAVRETERKYQMLATQKHIQLVADVPDTLPAITDVIPLQLALDALVSNAIEYTPENGQVRLALAARDKSAHIEVTNTGIGVPQEARERIFEKFTRAENAKLVKPNGTGLGLYIAKQSITKIMGTIGLASGEAGRTTFTIDIPLSIPAPQVIS